MNKYRKLQAFVSISLIGGTCLSALADTTVEARIAQARSAAPANISNDATIVVDGETVVEGSNGWVCMPDLMPNDNAPVCIDKVWQEMLAAVGEKAPYAATNIGISYMLQGEPDGSGVSNSDPYHPDPTKAHDYVETGPHLMIIVPKAGLEGLNDDPTKGGPYVMWKDTDYAHLMVPVD
jgi:hypothetical protein